MLKAVRYTQPNSDSNRSRWPNHKIWDALSDKVLDDFSQYPTNLSPDTLKQVQFETHDSLLLRQILGLVISRAGLRHLRANDLPTFIRQIGDELGTEIDETRNSIERKLKRSTERHRVVFQN